MNRPPTKLFCRLKNVCGFFNEFEQRAAESSRVFHESLENPTPNVTAGETFTVKIMVKKMTDKRLKLADIEIENNGGTDLAAYDLKVGRKNTAVDAFGNLTADKSAVSSGNNISIDDLIKFVNTYTTETIQIDD